jgi:hypothetical protein
VIVGQIKTREKARLLEGEARERENQQMKQLMKKYEDEDREKAEKRKLDVERSKQEIMAANAESIRRKDDAKLKELQEAEYLKMYQVIDVFLLDDISTWYPCATPSSFLHHLLVLKKLVLPVWFMCIFR